MDTTGQLQALWAVEVNSDVCCWLGLKNYFLVVDIKLDLDIVVDRPWWGSIQMVMQWAQLCSIVVERRLKLWAFFSTLVTNQSLSLISKLLPFTLPAEHSFIMYSLSASLPHSSSLAFLSSLTFPFSPHFFRHICVLFTLSFFCISVLLTLFTSRAAGNKTKTS